MDSAGAQGNLSSRDSGDSADGRFVVFTGNATNLVAGTSRWYAVYYRDPIVPGGCCATSTFNITQTQLVGWTL